MNQSMTLAEVELRAAFNEILDTRPGDRDTPIPASPFGCNATIADLDREMTTSALVLAFSSGVDSQTAVRVVREYLNALHDRMIGFIDGFTAGVKAGAR